MKTLVATTLCWLMLTATFAQKIIDKTFNYKQSQKITLDLKFGKSIVIKAWDKSEVGVHISVNINNNKLNDALKVTMVEDAPGIRVSSDYDMEMIKDAGCNDCPHGGTFSWNNNIRLCAEVIYTVRVPRTADINVETVDADMEIFDLEGPLKAKSISGFIDISRPTSTGADLSIKTITGECFSDIDINFSDDTKGRYSPGGTRISGKINGGGTPISVETISSNIYLRKKGKS